jgi:hypothetical protein
MVQLALSLFAMQLIVLFLIRPIVLWYFRLSRITRALESIDRSLKCLPAVQNAKIVVARRVA